MTISYEKFHLKEVGRGFESRPDRFWLGSSVGRAMD